MSVSLLLIAAFALPAQDEQVFSGPQPGEKLVPFTMVGAIGKDADRKIDIVKEAGDKPLVIVFVHKKTRPAFGLANAVMRLVADRTPDKIIGGLVYLDDDQTGAANWMNLVQKHFPKTIRKGISPDGAEGPGAYGLNRNISVTVLVAKDQKVAANFALIQPSMEVDAPKIFKAIADVLGEENVPRVAKYAGGRKTNEPRMKREPQKRGAQRQAQDPKLRPLLVPFIQKDATEKEVVAAAKKIEEYAKENPDSRRQIGDIARRIIAADKLPNYGTKKCQEFLTRWAKEYTPEERRKAKPPATEDGES